MAEHIMCVYVTFNKVPNCFQYKISFYITTSSEVIENSSSSKCLPTFDIVSLFNFRQSNGWQYPIVVLICISLWLMMWSNFMYLIATHVSSLVKCLLKICCPLKWIVFLLLNFYILYISPLSDIAFADNSS